MEMKSLYDKLKPSIKDELDESSAKYSTAKRLKYTLLSKTFWGDITIDDMKNLLTYANISGSELSPFDFMYATNLLEDE